jgi:hypothetical protein
MFCTVCTLNSFPYRVQGENPGTENPGTHGTVTIGLTNSGTDGTDPNAARTYRIPLVGEQYDLRCIDHNWGHIGCPRTSARREPTDAIRIQTAKLPQD